MTAPILHDQLGIILQDHSWRRRGQPLDDRGMVRVVRQTGALDTQQHVGTIGYGEETAGDLLGGFLWIPASEATRVISGWNFAWPSMLHVDDVPERQNIPPGATVITGPRTGLSAFPVFDGTWDLDRRFAHERPTFHPFWPNLPAGTAGIILDSIQEDIQEPLFFPCDPRLICVNRGADASFSSTVFDTDGENAIDPSFGAPLHSFWRVARPRKGCFGVSIDEDANALAWQLGRSGRDRIEGLGLVCDDRTFAFQGQDLTALIYAAAGVKGGGPLHVGRFGDKHLIGKTAENEDVVSLHLTTEALWEGRGGDAPIEFDETKWQPVHKLPFLARGYLRDDPDDSHDWVCGERPGLWKIQVETVFTVESPRCEQTEVAPQEEPDPDLPEIETGAEPLPIEPLEGFEGFTETPRSERFREFFGIEETSIPDDIPTIPGETPSVETPTGLNGVEFFGMNGVQQKGVYGQYNRGNKETQSFASTTMQVAIPAILARPQIAINGMPDLRSDPAPSQEDVQFNADNAPITARLEAFGAICEDGTTYCEGPCIGRYRGGIAEGGFLFMPGDTDFSEVNPDSLEGSDAWKENINPDDLCQAWFMMSYNTRFAYGVPDPCSGGLNHGFFTQIEADPDLLGFYHQQPLQAGFDPGHQTRYMSVAAGGNVTHGTPDGGVFGLPTIDTFDGLTIFRNRVAFQDNTGTLPNTIGHLIFQNPQVIDITSNETAWNPGDGNVFVLNPDSDYTIHGLDRGQMFDQFMIIGNPTNFTVTFANESGSAIAEDRITTGTGADIDVGPGQTIMIQHEDDSHDRFLVIGGSALASATTGSGSVGPIRTGNILYVDAVNGDDSTGTADRFDLPFLTIAAAITAASAGDLIVIRPGTYAITTGLIGKTGVSIVGMDPENCIISTSSAITMYTAAANSVLMNINFRQSNTSGTSFCVAVTGTTNTTFSCINCKSSPQGGGGAQAPVNDTSTGAASAPHRTFRDCTFLTSGLANGYSKSGSGTTRIQDCSINGLTGIVLTGTGTLVCHGGLASGFGGINVGASATMQVSPDFLYTGATISGTFARITTGDSVAQENYSAFDSPATPITVSNVSVTTIGTIAGSSHRAAGNRVHIHFTFTAENSDASAQTLDVRGYRGGTEMDATRRWIFHLNATGSHGDIQTFHVHFVDDAPSVTSNSYNIRAIASAASAIDITMNHITTDTP